MAPSWAALAPPRPLWNVLEGLWNPLLVMGVVFGSLFAHFLMVVGALFAHLLIFMVFCGGSKTLQIIRFSFKGTLAYFLKEL